MSVSSLSASFFFQWSSHHLRILIHFCPGDIPTTARCWQSQCLGFCICKMGTVALAPSCRCPRGARRPLALPRLLLASPSVRDGRWPCLLQVLSGTVLALGRDGNPLPPSCPHAATWAGRRGTSRVFHPSPPRPECGSMASSPTSERLLTAPAPCPVPWPVAPPRPAPAGAPAH